MTYSKKDYIQLSGPLFEEVQKRRVFDDSKTFVDSVPNKDPLDIIKMYKEKKDDLDLEEFVNANFDLPDQDVVKINLPENRTMEEHIIHLWKHLKRDVPKPSRFNSLISLPKPYIIPGGRFREIYYWDSYFTMQGLVISDEVETAENMLENFAHLIDELGHIPNGNRVYYISRSQPPFFAAMVDLLSEYKSKEWQLKFLPQLIKEYEYWMDENTRLVKLGPNESLNRYYDTETVPREESYFEDFKLSTGIREEETKNLFRNIRAACESGWDFSSRWFADGQDLKSCITTDLIPVDLNSLLYFTENKIAELYQISGDKKSAQNFEQRANRRKELIHKYCWDKTFFFDYNFKESKRMKVFSLASIYPLYFRILNQPKARSVINIIKRRFLKAGGVITTSSHTGQQWDAPNGWAPLQWMTIVGLRNYGFDALADEVKSRWLQLNRNVFKRTGKMFEKYDVEDTSLFAGGGEYDLQDGFGWTNGVALALTKNIDKKTNRN